MLSILTVAFQFSPLSELPTEFSLDSNAEELSRWLKSKGLSEEDSKIISGTEILDAKYNLAALTV